jgi:hypothetical protein
VTGRPHAINSTDEYLSLVLNELEGIRGLLDERLPAPAPEPPVEPVDGSVPVDIKEPAPVRKRAAKKATPATTTPEE